MAIPRFCDDCAAGSPDTLSVLAPTIVKELNVADTAHVTMEPDPGCVRLHAFVLFGVNADLCSECAQPLLEAKERMMENIIKARGET